MSLGNWTERLVVGYFVLDATDSVFLTAASFAVRQSPALLSAPIAGAVADRWPRARVLRLTALYKTAILAGLGAIVFADLPVLWPVFALTALSGVGQSFELPSGMGMVTDSVPRNMRMNAVAVQSTGARAVGALGALTGGLVIDGFGVPVALSIGAGAFLLAALATLFIRLPATQTPDAGAVPLKSLNVIGDAIGGLRALFGIPAVRVLLIAALAVEMFGFAFGAVLPAVSRDVLGQSGAGLGALQMMASFGGLAGVLIIAGLGDFERKGMLLIAINIMFGAFLIGFAASGLFPLSLALIAGVGMMAGGYDTMQWTLLQHNVPENMRGRAMGGWVFAVGFGWMGHLGLGALAEQSGVQWALGGAGLLVLLTGVLVWRASPGLRRA
jgi:MFS family permease